MQQCQDVVHSILLEYIILPCFLCRVGLELGTIELRSLLGDITPTQITAAGGNALDFAGVAGNGGDAVTGIGNAGNGGRVSDNGNGGDAGSNGSGGKGGTLIVSSFDGQIRFQGSILANGGSQLSDYTGIGGKGGNGPSIAGGGGSTGSNGASGWRRQLVHIHFK